MTITVADLVGAAGGGALGAALGALLAFSLMGAVVVVTTLVATVSSSTLVGGLAFGSTLGPHVSFAGGVAAAAYAAHIRKHESGRDIAAPLIGYNNMAIIAVGAAFGVLGQLAAQAVGAIPTVHTSGGAEVAMLDSIAVSVVLTALIAAALWGRKPKQERQQWLPWQHEPTAVLTIGAAAGCAAGSIYLAWPADSRPMAGLFAYGLSALSLIALVFGKPVPVTHHITLSAALAAALTAAHTDTPGWILLAAASAGILSSLIAEIWARVLLERCRVHLDPPAFAIAAMTTLLALVHFGAG